MRDVKVALVICLTEKDPIANRNKAANYCIIKMYSRYYKVVNSDLTKFLTNNDLWFSS